MCHLRGSQRQTPQINDQNQFDQSIVLDGQSGQLNVSGDPFFDAELRVLVKTGICLQRIRILGTDGNVTQQVAVHGVFPCVVRQWHVLHHFRTPVEIRGVVIFSGVQDFGTHLVKIVFVAKC